MKIASHRGAEENDGLEVRSACCAYARYEFCEFRFRNHVRPQFLPTATGAAATGASTAKTAEASASTKSASPTAKAAASSAASEHARKQNPEENITQRSGKDDNDNDDDQDDTAEGYSFFLRLTNALGRSAGLSVGELNSSVGRNHFGHAGCDQQQSLAVVAAAHQRDDLTLEAADLTIGENRLQPIANFNAITVILDYVEDQHAAVGRLRADAPLVEKIDGIALDVGAVERVDGDYGDLRMGFVVDLVADVFHLRGCAGVDDVGEIVDIAGGLELRDGLSPGGERERKESDEA